MENESRNKNDLSTTKPTQNPSEQKELEVILNNNIEKLNKTQKRLNRLQLRKHFFFWSVIFIYPVLGLQLIYINFFLAITILVVPLIPWLLLIISLDTSANIYINKIKIIATEIDKINNKILKEKCKDPVFQEKEIEKISKKIRWLDIILFISAPSGWLGIALIIGGLVLTSTNSFAGWAIIILGNVFCFWELYLKSELVYKKKRYKEYIKKIRNFNSNKDINNIPHTLILRSFEDDGMWIPMIVGGYTDSELIPDTTFEELLNDIFKRYGSVQICDAPFLTLPYVGAERFFLVEDWRDIIKSKATGSQLIVIIPPISFSKGLEWELSMLIEQNLLSKIVLIFPPDNIENIKSRWLSFQKTVNKYSNIRFNGTIKYKQDPICCTFSEEQDNNIKLKVKYIPILAILSPRIRSPYTLVLPSVIKKMIFS